MSKWSGKSQRDQAFLSCYFHHKTLRRTDRKRVRNQQKKSYFKSSHLILKQAKDLSRHISKENTQMANHQGNANTMRYHFKHVKMAVTKRTSDGCQGGYGRKGTSVNNWWEYTLVKPLWFPVWQFKKLMAGLLSIYPRK